MPTAYCFHLTFYTIIITQKIMYTAQHNRHSTVNNANSHLAFFLLHVRNYGHRLDRIIGETDFGLLGTSVVSIMISILN